MAPTVTRLRFQQKNPERVNVDLDGQYAFSLPAVEAARLRRGQELSAAEIATLQDRDAFGRAYDKVLRFLGYRPRSEAEVRRYLQGKGEPEERIAAVLERLQAADLVDDVAFARFWVENRQAFRPRGRRALTHELRQKGVSGAVIDEALAGLDTEGQAAELALRQAARWQNLERKQFYQKLIDYLMRRGFDYAEARAAVDLAWEQTSQAASDSET